MILRAERSPTTISASAPREKIRCGAMPKANVTLNLTAQAYSKLRGEILGCRLWPGQKLTISSLCKEHGYSLGAVREALSRLTSEGLVEAEPNKGFRVVPITQAELEDLTRTRVLIECQCVTRSIACGDLKWESGIVSALFELSRIDLTRPDDPHRINPHWADAHGRFHGALVGACDSPWLLRLREILTRSRNAIAVSQCPPTGLVVMCIRSTGRSPMRHLRAMRRKLVNLCVGI